MPKYTYNGPRAGVIHPATGERLVLISGQSYDLPKDSLLSLMSSNRPEHLGRLTVVEEPKPAKAVADSRPTATATPVEDKPESTSKRSRRSSSVESLETGPTS